MERSYLELILGDLSKKMVFITGPRQVGKTWLSKKISEKYKNPIYLNYDSADDRDIIINRSWFGDHDLIIFDEIHKMSDWKIYLKGIFDTKNNEHILVTGSARLDTFNTSGESLAGRFFKYRLMPFTHEELGDDSKEVFKKLINRGGFPEPYLAEDDIDARRWRLQYSEGLIRDDILDFEKISDYKSLKLLFELLRKKVGSTISYSSLAEDIQISPTTVKKYINTLESLFIIFRVTPYSKNIARSILKDSKIYFYDNGLVKGDDGAKFENFVAVSLLRHVYYKEDIEGIKSSLNFLRTKEKKEVDFALVYEDKIDSIIEAKVSDKTISKTLKYFNEKYSFKSIQLVSDLKHEKKLDSIEVRLARRYLRSI